MGSTKKKRSRSRSIGKKKQHDNVKNDNGDDVAKNDNEENQKERALHEEAQEECKKKEEDKSVVAKKKEGKGIKDKKEKKVDEEEEDDVSSESDDNESEEDSDNARKERDEDENKEDDDDNDDDDDDEDDADNDENDDDDGEQEQNEIGEREKPDPGMMVSDGKYRNKQRCLALCSRGITARYRHLLEDLCTLIPHHKKESKLDPSKIDGVGKSILDICGIRNCNTVLFLESRKRGRDGYLWMGSTGVQPAAFSEVNATTNTLPGPSIQFHITNIHTMDELKLTGNCMKGSRPILSFDESFERFGHLKVMKHLFMDVFGIPRGHPKTKPFVDRVMAFYYADKKIWVRHYQILEEQPTNALEAANLAKRQKQKFNSSDDATKSSLIEIGPRFVLNPIKIFRGFFTGQILYNNPDYVSNNERYDMQKRALNEKYKFRKQSQRKRKRHTEQIVVPDDPLDSVFKE